MKIGKRFISISLVVFLLLGVMTGCGSKKEPVNSSKSTGPVPIKIFANFTSAEQTKVDQAWQKKIEEACNVKLSFEVPPSSGYGERLQVMLAGGDYPDVVYFGSTTDKNFVNSVNNGIIVPVTKYINDAPNLKKYSYDYSFDALKVKENDDIYGIPRTTVQRGDGFIIRKDWADAVGFQIPSDNLLTIDQFRDLMTKFSKNDPDGNGKNDTYGFATSADGEGNLWPIMGYAFGDLGWQKVTGEKYEYMTPMYDKESPVYKDELQFTQDLYKNGLLDPNAPSIKHDAAKQRFFQGVTGAIGEFSGWISQYVAQIAKVNPKAKLTYISGLKNAEGKFQETSFGTGLWGFWAVTSAAKRPDAIVKLFDYMLSDEGWSLCKDGVKGVSYTEENGVKKPTADYGDFAQNGWARCFVRRNDDPSFFVALDTPDEYKDPVTKWIDIAIKAKVVSLDFGYRPAAADKPELIDYGKAINQTVSKIVTGASPVSDWDKTLDGWYKAGGAEYVQQMNDYIKKTQDKK
ncbi:MAG: extracellular solute-binding protein [Clostridiales bacterium]|nr:extracellular solute-binding protein [Clostridiales bacterium]